MPYSDTRSARRSSRYQEARYAEREGGFGARCVSALGADRYPHRQVSRSLILLGLGLDADLPFLRSPLLAFLARLLRPCSRLEDLYSLLHFLRLEPWGNFSFFKTFITTPFEKKDPKAIEVIQVVLESIRESPVERSTATSRKLADSQLPVPLQSCAARSK